MNTKLSVELSLFQYFVSKNDTEMTDWSRLSDRPIRYLKKLFAL